MTTLVIDTVYPKPAPATNEIAAADLVVLRHPEGRWTVYKDREGFTAKRVPWDSLPCRVKDAVAEEIADEAR